MNIEKLSLSVVEFEEYLHSLKQNALQSASLYYSPRNKDTKDLLTIITGLDIVNHDKLLASSQTFFMEVAQFNKNTQKNILFNTDILLKKHNQFKKITDSSQEGINALFAIFLEPTVLWRLVYMNHNFDNHIKVNPDFISFIKKMKLDYELPLASFSNERIKI